MRFCLLLFHVSFATAQIVEGYVVNSATGKGISGVRVDLAQGGDVYYTARSDDQGHFLFDHVQNGTYRAFYSSPDYFEIPEGGALRQFQVVTGGNSVKLKARLTPFASVTGRVVDREGKGVPGAIVSMEGPQSSTSERTSEGGKFGLRRFLLAGAYTLSVAPPVNLKPPQPDPDTGAILNWTRTWYPGVATRQESAAIVVAAGGEISDLEVKLLAVPAHAVRGVLLDPDGKAAPKVKITLGEEAHLPRSTAETNSDGAFEFPGVADGEWLLSAEMDRGGVKLRCTEWLLVAGRAPDTVKLRLARPIRVVGKALMDRPAGAPTFRAPLVILSPRTGKILGAEDPQNVTLGLRVAPGAPNARPDSEGNLVFENVYPGPYRIVPLDPPTPYYLDTIRLGEVDLATPEVEISSSASILMLVYRTDGGAVRGSAENCESGGVRLIPTEPSLRRPGFLRSRACDSNGRYEISAVRPGEYYVMAIAGKGGSWLTAAISEAALQQSVKVTVRAAEISAADLRAIPAPAF